MLMEDLNVMMKVNGIHKIALDITVIQDTIMIILKIYVKKNVLMMKIENIISFMKKIYIKHIILYLE